MSNSYDDLIQEFSDQRKSIKLMIDDMEKIKLRIDSILPESLDKRYIRFFEEKVKSITELFKLILELRKEITKNAKDEFELRRKNDKGEDDFDDSTIDIKKIADRIDKVRKDKLLLEEKLIFDNKNIDIKESEEILI